jgi:O6-methylguanine-DNA--protein-cysteine methyltransferase
MLSILKTINTFARTKKEGFASLFGEVGEWLIRQPPDAKPANPYQTKMRSSTKQNQWWNAIKSIPYSA